MSSLLLPPPNCGKTKRRVLEGLVAIGERNAMMLSIALLFFQVGDVTVSRLLEISLLKSSSTDICFQVTLG